LPICPFSARRRKWPAEKLLPVDKNNLTKNIMFDNIPLLNVENVHQEMNVSG